MSEIRKIENFAAPELDVYARLSEPQLLHYYEPQPGPLVRLFCYLVDYIQV